MPHGGGARPKRSEEKKWKVVDLVAKGPEATLAELRPEIKKRLQVEVSLGTLWHLLDSLGLRRKKGPDAPVKLTRKSVSPSRRNSRRWR